MSEPRVAKPNKTECGFWKRGKEWERGVCKIARCECIFYPRGDKFCGIGQSNRALYARQQAEREAAP